MTKKAALCLRGHLNYQYTGFDIDGGLVLLYNDSSCKVFNMTGTEKYNGTFDFTVNKVSAGQVPWDTSCDGTADDDGNQAAIAV